MKRLTTTITKKLYSDKIAFSNNRLPGYYPTFYFDKLPEMKSQIFVAVLPTGVCH